MMSEQVAWLEGWIDSASMGAYIVVLRAHADGSLQLVDPQKPWEVVATFGDYETAAQWLHEDEYDLLEGRWWAADR